MADLIDMYTPREWHVYQVRVGDEFRSLDSLINTKCNLWSCGGESEFAQDHYRRTGGINDLFFYDVEQVFMNLDKCYGQMGLGFLKEPWRGHPAETLVFVMAKGVDEGYFTVGVEKTTQ